jgi:predicted amidohydrolase
LAQAAIASSISTACPYIEHDQVGEKLRERRVRGAVGVADHVDRRILTEDLAERLGDEELTLDEEDADGSECNCHVLEPMPPGGNDE